MRAGVEMPAAPEAAALALLGPAAIDALPDGELPRRYADALRLCPRMPRGTACGPAPEDIPAATPGREAMLRRLAVLRSVLAGGPAAMAAEGAACAADVARLVNRWCWTFDPRLPVGSLPFDLFPNQEAFLLWLAERERRQEGGLLEKSRDMGATWLCVAYAAHGWLFRDGFACGFGSRKLDLVDKLADADSIIEKLRLLLDMLPPFLMPAGYSRERHAGYCKVVNPENGSAVTGEGGDQIGRGGRKALFFVDEAAFLTRPQLVERSLSQTTNVRIDVSTPNGPGNPFARRRHSGTVPVFTLHWRDDPRKGEEWYAAMKATKDAVTVAQEIDIDYSASVEGTAIPAAWVRAAVNLLPDLMGPPRGRPVAGLDVAEMGSNQSVLARRWGPRVSPLIAWGMSNTTETAHRAREAADKDGCAVVHYDVGGVGAGVRGTWDSSDVPLPFKAVAVNAGSSPTNVRWPDGKTSRERFVNLRAELWWTLRMRFEKAYESREKGVAHPEEEMISIPDDPELIAQLSMPLSHRAASGKIGIESKDDMRRRGMKSPDRADALCLAFHPPVTLPPGAWRMESI